MRATAVARSLQHLPDALLRAMVRGIRANSDELEPGALFTGPDSGGCAIGLTLRELAPDAFQFGRVEFWLWHRWRRGVEPDVARRFPQLQQLQRLFDDAVIEVEASGEAEAAKTVGLWFAASAESELRRRGMSATAGRRRANSSGRWRRPHVRPPRRRHAGSRITEHYESETENSSCS